MRGQDGDGRRVTRREDQECRSLAGPLTLASSAGSLLKGEVPARRSWLTEHRVFSTWHPVWSQAASYSQCGAHALDPWPPQEGTW